MRESDRMVVTSCHGSLNPGKKYVAIRLLTDETLYCVVEAKTRVQNILEQIGNYVGIKDIYLFGLARQTDNELIFLNQEVKISKYAPKQWKAQSNYGLDGTGRPLMTIHLRIQFYVDCHLLIREKVTRFHYYLQLRENILNYYQHCSEEQYFLLCAYGLQADAGNYFEDKHVGQYFEPKEYFPPWIIERVGRDYVIQNMPSMHKDLYGVSRGEAQMSFIREASCLNAPFNFHVYKLLTKKNDDRNSVLMAVCPKGIELHLQKPEGTMELLTTFLWPNIKKLCFEKKKFEIRVASYPEIRKYTYFANSDEKAKYLFHLCKITHQLTMALESKILELKSDHQESKKIYRESYIYSDSFDLEWEQEHGSVNMTYKNFATFPKTGKGLDQRTSVISNASSNTTSGIVSDKVQSLDGSEDDLELEVLINSPSAASTESLPTAVISGKEWEPRLHCRSSSASNFIYNDLSGDLSSVKLRTVVTEKPFPHPPKCSNISAATSRTDSSSSHRSLSTIRSFSQKNVNDSDCKIRKASVVSSQQYCNRLTNSKDSRVSLSLNSLPKMDVVANFDPTFNHPCDPIQVIRCSPCDNASSQTLSHPRTKKSTQAATIPEEKMSFGKPERVQKTKTSLSSTSRILTSIGAQAPLVPPPNLAVHLPHIRTKIGVSSLSRPIHSSNFLFAHRTNSPELDGRHPSHSKSISANLPPTPLFNVGGSSELPKYEPVITNASLSNNYDTSKTFRTVCVKDHRKTERDVAFGLDKTVVQVDNFATLILDQNADRHPDDEFKFDSQDIFIPPPPLYANSAPGTNELESEMIPETNCEHFQFLAGVTKLREEQVLEFSSNSMLSPSQKCRSQKCPERNHLLELNSINLDLSLEDSFDESESSLSELIIPPPPLSLNEMLTAVGPKACILNWNCSSVAEAEVSPVQVDEPPLDIDILRKRSKDLDLPLIAALCNDRSLLPSTGRERLVPRRRMSCGNPESSLLSGLPAVNRPLSWHLGSAASPQEQQAHGIVTCEATQDGFGEHLQANPRTVCENLTQTKASSTTSLTRHFLGATKTVLNGLSTSSGIMEHVLQNRNFDASVA